jgi:hypothetical protein
MFEQVVTAQFTTWLNPDVTVLFMILVKHPDASALELRLQTQADRRCKLDSVSSQVFLNSHHCPHAYPDPGYVPKSFRHVVQLAAKAAAHGIERQSAPDRQIKSKDGDIATQLNPALNGEITVNDCLLTRVGAAADLGACPLV